MDPARSRAGMVLVNAYLHTRKLFHQEDEFPC